MDHYICKTNLGEINITKAAIVKVVEDAAERQKGKLYVATRKGKSAGSGFLLGKIDVEDATDVSVDEDGIHLNIYVVIAFGTSISKVTGEMMTDIHRGIVRLFGPCQSHIGIHLVGTLSKRVIKRDIKFEKSFAQ